MIVTIFRKSTGQILRIANIPVEMVSIQLTSPDEGWIEGQYPGNQFYIENLTAVPIPPQPSDHHEFDYATKQWVDTRTVESEAAKVRWKRDALLAASDWTQLPDVPLATKEAWAAYRQALRDITDQPGFPFDVVWPQAPG